MAVETPPPNDSFKASLSPPVGHLHSFRRYWQTNKYSSNMLHIITNGYVLPFLSKPNLVSFLWLYQNTRPFKKTKHWLIVSRLYLCQKHNRKGGKCKISQVLQSPVFYPQASQKVEASNRLKPAQHFSTCRKVQNGNFTNTRMTG